VCLVFIAIISPIMCAYKLCKVEFRYWGLQSRVESFVHSTGIKKTLIHAHKQARAFVVDAPC
jgi:hypothetical protein